MNMGFGNGGSSSSFSNLSPLAPPFTLDRSVTKPFSSPLLDMTEPSFGVPLNSSLPNWLPPNSKTSGLDFFSTSTSEFDWLPLSSGSRYPRSQAMVEPSDNHGPILGRLTLTMSSTDPSYHNSSDGLTTSVHKAKPYYPSYASTAPTVIVDVDQPSYDWLWNSHVDVATFDVPPCTDFSRGSSGSERLLEEASHSIDMLDPYNCNEFVGEYPNEELLLEQNLNRISNMELDAHSAFPGCHPKTRTPASSSQSCQFLKKAPYQEIFREQDARRSVTTSIVNSPATFSIRPPVVCTDSFVWNTGPCHTSDYGYDFFEAKQCGSGNDLSNLKEFLPVNSESKEFFSTENHDTCIDKNDPVITESSSTKIHDVRNNMHYAKDSPDCRLKAGVRFHIHDASPHFNLNLKTIETDTTIESSSESFDQYNLAVDSPCWKGAPISRISPFQAFEIVTPSRAKTMEVCDSMNLPLSQVPPSTAEDSVKVFVHEPNESTIGSILEKGATSSPKMPSVAGSSLPAVRKTIDSVKAGEFCSKMGYFHPDIGSIHEPVEDDGDSHSSRSMPQNKYKHNLVSGKRIVPTSCMEKHAHARLNSDNYENGLNHLSFNAAEHVQNFPSELVKSFHGETISKIDTHILVDTLHSLSELLLAHCLNGLDALHRKDVKSIETVMNNLDVCINSVGSQGSLSPKQRTPQSLELFHQLHTHFQDVGMPKSQSQMTKIEGGNLECQSNDRCGVEETKQHILSVKKDREAADSLYLRNEIDSMKEDSMTKALKKVLSESFHSEEEHPQTLLYKNLWLEAEAALCASNLRARFNSAKLEKEKHVSPKVKEHAKNRDELQVSDVSPGSNAIAKSTSKTKVGSTSFVSAQTSPAVSVSSSHGADDVINRFNILKYRDDEPKHRDGEESETLSDLVVLIKQNMVEKSEPEKKQTAVPYMNDMDSCFPTWKVNGNDSAPALPSTSFILTRSSDIDDVMSRFQILRSRDERISSLNAAPKVDIVHSAGMSTIHHPIADNKNGVDNGDGSVLGRVDVVRNRGNNIGCTPGREKLQYPSSKKVYWPTVENEVKKGGLDAAVEMEPGQDIVEAMSWAGFLGCSDGSFSLN